MLQHLVKDGFVFSLRTVAENNSIRFGQPGRFLGPGFHRSSHGLPPKNTSFATAKRLGALKAIPSTRLGHSRQTGKCSSGSCPTSVSYPSPARQVSLREGPIELRAWTASFKWQVSPLLLNSLHWHRARTEPSRKVSCQSAYCRATLFGGSREKCFAFRSRSVDGTEYVTYPSLKYGGSRMLPDGILQIPATPSFHCPRSCSSVQLFPSFLTARLFAPCPLVPARFRHPYSFCSLRSSPPAARRPLLPPPIKIHRHQAAP